MRKLRKILYHEHIIIYNLVHYIIYSCTCKRFWFTWDKKIFNNIFSFEKNNCKKISRKINTARSIQRINKCFFFKFHKHE